MQSRNARFGGELASILYYTLHPSAFFVGSVCGGIVFGLIILLAWMQLGRISPLVVQAVAFLFVIRVALNSAYGTSPLGGVFKATGSDWPTVASALGRLFLLNLIWAVPLVIMGNTLSAAPGALLTGGGLGGPAALLTLGLLLLPPLFLVVSVAADSLNDLFDPDHWRSVFAGRWHDVVALFVTYVGGVTAAGGLAFMVGGSLGNGKPGPTVFFMAIAGGYSAGVFLLLLGRLVGGFLRTAGGEATFDAAPQAPAPHAGNPYDGVDVDEFEPMAPPTHAHAGRASAASTRSSADERVSASVRVSGPSPEIAMRASAEESLGEALRRLQRLAQTDPEHALEELLGLVSTHGPHPLVMARTAVLQKELDPGVAFDTAQQAAALAVKVANPGVLGELYEAFPDRMNELGVPAEQWQNVAAALQALGKTPKATELYGQLLTQDPTNVSAIKGLIQIADAHLKSETGAEDALAIYEGLEKMCPDHPFVEFVERGREAASRRLTRVR